jgi:F0F1-type ATP synthase membrane subunit c/vacuolar-type H+-ATPase subunit K
MVLTFAMALKSAVKSATLMPPPAAGVGVAAAGVGVSTGAGVAVAGAGVGATVGDGVAAVEEQPATMTAAANRETANFFVFKSHLLFVPGATVSRGRIRRLLGRTTEAIRATQECRPGNLDRITSLG